MYGTKGRIGLLVPSCNTVVERDFNRLLPEGYVAIADRMWMEDEGSHRLRTMTSQAVERARELRTAHPDVVLFACTSASFLDGVAGEFTLRRELEHAAGCPVVTTSGALVQALRRLDAHSVAVATPYLDEIDRDHLGYLRAQGFEASDLKSLKIPDSELIGHCSVDDVYDLATALDYSQADAILISCTNLPTLDVINRIETTAGRPVVTSNQASFSAVMQTLAFTGRIHGFGTLLEGPLSSVAR